MSSDTDKTREELLAELEDARRRLNELSRDGGGCAHVRPDELLETVEEAGYKMFGMLRMSMDLPRLENGTFVPEISSFDFARLLRRILSLQEAYARFRRITTQAGGQRLGTYSAMLVARAHGGTVRLDTSTPGVTCVILPERLA